MKRNIPQLLLALLFVFTTTVFSQYPTTNPTYTATLANDQLVAANQYEFDIIITHTGGGTPFECQGAQIGLLFNNLIKGTGTLSAAYLAGTSQMVAGQTPGAPSLGSVTGDPNTGIFRVAPKAALVPGDGTTISPTGTRLGRFRISTNAAAFAQLQANLAWNFLTTSGRYPTKISAFVEDGTLEAVIAKDVTVQAGHLNTLSNAPLPVELTSFSAANQGRDVNLSWETKTEVNTSIFQVERTAQSTQSWVKVGEVAANGNSNSPKEYSYADKKLSSGKYSYRLKMIDNDGTFKYSDAVETEVSLPKDYAISQNYPNPFNPTTRIDYQLPFDSKVTLELYGITGEKVATLINSELRAGYYTADVNASAMNLASGVYIYRITAQNPSAQNFVQVKKLMLTK